MRALYYYREDGYIKCMLVTHVDDMIWATRLGSEWIMDAIPKKFALKRVEENTFRFYGREIVQSHDCSISVTC